MELTNPQQDTGLADVRRHLAQADILLTAGQYQAALELIDGWLTHHPDAVLLNRRGLILEALNRFAEAGQSYQRAISLQADFADSYLNLAVLIHRRPGEFDNAISLCRQALAAAGQSSKAYIMLGCIYQSRSIWDAAEQCHRQALGLNPDAVEAHQNLGLICTALNQHSAAAQHFRRALDLRPDCSRTWNDLGISLRAAGHLQEALNAYDKALALKPDFDMAWYHKGNLLQKLEQFEQAANAYIRAIKVKHDNAGYWNNIGVVLRAMNQNKRALQAYRKAIEYAPQTAEFHNNLGLVLESLDQSEAAIESYNKAIHLKPDFAEAWRNMGDSFKELCQPEAAIECYRKALEKRPDYYSTWWNLSLALLLNGQLREGFALYLYRNQPELNIFTYPHNLPALRWDGSSFAGQTLLIYCEQGFGDSIQFVRYLRAARQRGGRLLLETPPALVRLFEQSNLADAVIAASDLPPAVQYDLCASIMDLPAIFKTTRDTIPQNDGHLSANSNQVDLWRGLIDRTRLNIGIVWAGNPKHGNDKNRSCPLELFAALQRTCPQAHFYSLQKGMSAEDQARLQGHPEIIDLQHSIADFADTAAVMQCLDLVITVDTAVAHLAGALGRPVWTLLPFSPDWRWLLNRTDSPWYPTMRLFRQGTRGDWPGVFKQVQHELILLCRQKEVQQAR